MKFSSPSSQKNPIFTSFLATQQSTTHLPPPPKKMASIFSLFSLLVVILVLSSSTIPTQSQKTQLSGRRNLALIDQETEDQPIPKPIPKKKSAAPVEQEEEVGKPIPKPKPKKKTAAPIEQVQEEDVPISRPKSKKKTSELVEQGMDEQSISKPKKKNLAFDSKNQTKPMKPKKSNSTSTSTSIPTLSSTPKSKLNKTQTLKPTNSTKIPKPPKNSTKTLNSTKPIKVPKLNTTKTQIKPAIPTPKPAKKANPVNPDPAPDPIWLDDTGLDSDLIAEFRDLPTRIHQALLPDLKRISITSKAYIYKANKNMAENMEPFVGNKFAPKIATAASCVFLILPLCLVTLLFYHLNSYLSLQRFLIFVQAYLAIYFFTLALTAVVTGLEPLKFFYATSPSSYAWTQAVQTLGYLLYLLVQLIHLVVVFSAGETKIRGKALGLAQMIVGLAVGCHYYAAVFHRAVTGEAPRANWKVHGVYAGCFLIICICARAESRKKAYDGGEDGKKS